MSKGRSSGQLEARVHDVQKLSTLSMATGRFTGPGLTDWATADQEGHKMKEQSSDFGWK